MRKTNHKMIELARGVRGVTQKELSVSLKISQSTLSKIERGEFGVSDVTTEEIAKVLEFPLSFFYQEEVKTPIANIYFRKRATINQKSLDKIIGDIKIILKSVDYLLEDVEITEYPRYKFDISDGWTPETVALRMREILKLQNGPITEPVKFLEEMGIIVYFYDCKELKFDGLTAYTDSGTPVIFVNSNLPNDRIKFTLGHELCHLLCHIPCNVEPWRDYESEANRFPGEFFMPTKECKSDLFSLTFNKLTVLKSYWGLSKSAIAYKAKSGGFINESTYKYMIIELSRRGERKSESGFVDIDTPSTINKVISLLETELDYTDIDIAEKLCIGLQDYIRLFKPYSENYPKIRVKRLKIAV